MCCSLHRPFVGRPFLSIFHKKCFTLGNVSNFHIHLLVFGLNALILLISSTADDVENHPFLLGAQYTLSRSVDIGVGISFTWSTMFDGRTVESLWVIHCLSG